MTFHCQPPFLSFHISSQCFYIFLHSCSYIPASLLAKARLVRLWFLAIPLRLEQRWTVPRWAHWQLTGSVQGWLWSMDGWMGMSCWHALWSFFCWWHTLVLLSPSLCGLVLTTAVSSAECSSQCLVLLSCRKCLPLPLFMYSNSWFFGCPVFVRVYMCCWHSISLQNLFKPLWFGFLKKKEKKRSQLVMQRNVNLTPMMSWHVVL